MKAKRTRKAPGRRRTRSWFQTELKKSLKEDKDVLEALD